MTDKDFDRFSEAIAALAVTFNREASEFLLQSYFVALKEFALEDVEKAAVSCISECKFMPAPAEIRERLGVGSSESYAPLAWETVITAIRRIGGYESVWFEDDATGQCVKALGGWRKLCDSTAADLHSFTRNSFLKMYPTLCRRPPGREEAGRQTGIFGSKYAKKVAAAYLPETLRVELLPAPEPVHKTYSFSELQKAQQENREPVPLAPPPAPKPKRKRRPPMTPAEAVRQLREHEAKEAGA